MTLSYTYQFIPLLHLLLAHLVADFMLQTKKMVDNKGWFTTQMGLHIFFVFVTAWLFTGNIYWALIISPIHWLTDGIKTWATKRNIGSPQKRFLIDQFFHILTVVLVWAISTENANKIIELIHQYWFGYRGSLILIGYITVIWPLGFIIKITTSSINKKIETYDEESVQHGGMLIGQFERVIILTLVLMGEYQAIGFLITGKSILRFANQNEKYTSEYVLVGTLMSYALSIVIGVLINLLL